MSNSRWNHGSSIPISSLDEVQLKEAMKAWSEENPYMERLLWSCYNNNVVTSGCCVHELYLVLNVSNSSDTNLRRIIAAAEKFGNARLQLSMSASNPFSGPDWHQNFLIISTSKRNRKNLFLQSLSEAFENHEDISGNQGFASIIDFYEFLKDKDSELLVDMQVAHRSCYTLTLEYDKNPRNNDFYSKILPKTGLILETNISPRCPSIPWKIECSNANEFNDFIQNCLQILKSEWTLDLRRDISKDMPFASQALLMRRKFGATPEGIQQLNNWLNTKRPPELPPVNY
ncbi:MAG: hypothetical protein IJ217_01425 [Clostridia bacterium]|nr:hypothetical protein [Clostridia bacterium]